jgi:sulfur carrier protein
MNIVLNGQPARTDATGLLALVAEVTGRDLHESGQPVDGSRLGVAVALNSEVVPRSAWVRCALNDGDDVELVTAVQGG